MADNGGFDGEQRSTTTFSQLLFADDVVLGVDMSHHQVFNNYSCSSAASGFSAHEKTPKMLCFGNRQQNDGEIIMYSETATRTSTPQKSGVTCSDSSSASSGNNSGANTPFKSGKKRNGSGQGSVQCSIAPVSSQRTSKKTKAADNPSSTSHAKAKKEKLGDRITALQQLVSPFGKTDTASVLHEAMGYIRFLHDQVQVLSSPYLQHHQSEGGGENGDQRKDLKSRGLCLVPVACTIHVANSNGADFWSPAMGSNISSSSSVTKQQQYK